jgi:[ribosomal protein S18]-alanine N-acetyltransferase
MRIRHATSYDLPKMIALERSTETAAHWGEGQYTTLFDPSSLHRVVFIAEMSDQTLVPASTCDKVCGYVIAQAAGPEWELENIIVDPAMLRSGLGSQLLSALLAEARTQGCQRMLLEVRDSNLAARRLYEKHGFQESGRRPGYYGNPTEDAILMQLLFSTAALESA